MTGVSAVDMTDAAPAHRRARWPWVLLIVVVLLAALVVAAEFLARSILPGIVRGIVVEQLDLPADQQLDVEADGVLLPQLIGGTLDELHLSTDRVTLEGLTGAVDVTATGVSLRGDGLAAATGVVRLAEDEFPALLARTELPIEQISLAEPDATATGAVQVFGIDIPISLTLTPGAEDGDVLLTPIAISVGGAQLDAEQVRDRLGAIGETITQTQRICVADQLPAGLTITDLRIEGSTAVAEVAVDGAIIADEALQRPGTCG